LDLECLLYQCVYHNTLLLATIIQEIHISSKKDILRKIQGEKLMAEVKSIQAEHHPSLNPLEREESHERIRKLCGHIKIQDSTLIEKIIDSDIFE
jgi:hypothetical protein